MNTNPEECRKELQTVCFQMCGFEVTDEWFLQCHAKHLTEEFCNWWIAFYETPSEYGDSEEEYHEYFVRMAFALNGWRAARGEKP